MPGASDRERQLCDGRLILLRQMPQFTDWYFSEKGGLMLTSHNRDLYFALQDLVEAVGSKPDWQAKRIGKTKDAFQALVGERRDGGRFRFHRTDLREVGLLAALKLGELVAQLLVFTADLDAGDVGGAATARKRGRDENDNDGGDRKSIHSRSRRRKEFTRSSYLSLPLSSSSRARRG